MINTVKEEKPRGRPRLARGGTEQFSMRWPSDMMGEIDAIHGKDFPLLNRADVVRILVGEAIAARNRGKQKK